VSRWREATLGETTELLTGFPFRSPNYTDDEDGIALVRGDNVVQGRFRWDDVKRWRRNDTAELSDYFLQAGDVILAMDRPWIEAGLKYACVADEDLPCLLVQRVTRLRARSGLDQGFLRYLIGSKEFTQHVLGVQTGTAVPHISGPQIKQFGFRCPPLPEQRAIASVLGALDDKIELNRRMNETLEALAQSLFKAWFVDAIRDGLPKGWREDSLDKIARFLNGLALQKFPPEGKDALPVIKIAQLRAGNTDGADRASSRIPPEYVIEDGDVLFSWSGSLEVELWCGGRGALNQHLFKVTSQQFPKWFYFLWTRHHLPDFQGIAAGKATTMGHIQRRHLTGAEVCVPSAAQLDKMDTQMSPLIEKLIANNIESRTLAALRDALLPKLLSGELRLPPQMLRQAGVAA
jgi:type I restriction enzyme S subunit